MGVEAPTDDALQRIEDRLARVEAALARLTGLLDAALPLVAMAGDVVDEEARAVGADGVGVDARLGAAAGLARAVTTPATAAALGQLAARVGALEDHVAGLPGAAAMVLDAADAELARLAARGVDVDATARRLGEHLLLLADPATGRLLRGAVAHADALEAGLGLAGAAGDTVAMALDVVDAEVASMAARGVDVDVLLGRARDVLELLADPRVGRLVAGLPARLDLIEGTLDVLARGPETAAMALDMVDDLMAAAARDGVDLGLLAPRLYDGTKALVAFFTSDGFHAFMEAMAEPEAFAHLVPIIRSIREATAAPPEPVSVWRLLGLLNDPQMQSALGLFVRFASAVGQTHDAHHTARLQEKNR